MEKERWTERESEREREREREGERKRQREREREREMDREREREMDRERKRGTERERDRQTDRERGGTQREKEIEGGFDSLLLQAIVHNIGAEPSSSLPFCTLANRHKLSKNKIQSLNNLQRR